MKKTNVGVKFLLPLITNLSIYASNFLTSCYHSNSNENEANPNNKPEQNNPLTNEESNSNILFNKRGEFKTNYNTIESLDKNPAVFNDTDKLLVDDIKAYRPRWMFNDPYKALYIGGVKSYYDYVLQMNNHGDTSQIKKRYERLKSKETVLSTKQQKVFGSTFTEASTYNLNELAEIYGQMYNGQPAAKNMYGFNIFDFSSPKYQDSVSPDYFNWLSFNKKGKSPGYSFYSFYDMHKYSKRFYERSDRHFLQRRINSAYSDTNHPLHIKSVKGYQHNYKGGCEGFDQYYNDNYYANGIPDQNDPIGVFVWGKGGRPGGHWDPASFYGNEFYMSPFRAIMNSNISSLSLKLLANWVDFNLNLMNMLNNDKKTFYELIDNPTFKNTLNYLKNSALELLKPTNYANWVEEGPGKPYKFFSDEIDLMKGSKSLSPKGELSNQRQFYKLALHIYNQVVQPFDYYLNDKLRPENVFDDLVDSKKSIIINTALHNTYYNNDKSLGKIASIEGINPTAKLKNATDKIKSFMENWLGDKDNKELISNIISKYNLKSKDFTPTGIKGEWLERPREKTS